MRGTPASAEAVAVSPAASADMACGVISTSLMRRELFLIMDGMVAPAVRAAQGGCGPASFRQ
ncbi:hypothetical protein GCM10009678_79180 [Actinomadura kijaniata]